MRLNDAERERRENLVMQEANKLGDRVTVLQVMKQTGFSRDFVECTLIKNNCKYEKSWKKRWTQEAIDGMVEMLNKGASYSEVAVKYEITKQRVSEVLKKNGYVLKYVKDDRPVITRRLR